MKEKLLEYLSCPTCSRDFVLQNVTESVAHEIIAGELFCRGCEKLVRIIRGVPRFASLDVIGTDKVATAENFGWQWQHFTQTDTYYDDQFLGWIAPVTPDFFRGKVVLEGGCGKGRHTQLAARWDAKEVVGVDLSSAVETAFAATRDLDNVHIIQADIYNLPLKRVFDYAFSVGVLHHMPEPFAGFRSLAGKVKKGGHLSAWVYGAENNRWITSFVDPLRERFTSRMKKPVLLQLSKIPTAFLFLATKLIYGPLNRSDAGSGLAKQLFYNDYLNAISKFGWREHHTIVFDHLVAPTSHYIPRKDFAEWWKALDAEDVRIEWHNKNSWRGFGRL
ncbi:MAG TPA: methyltransferase domain-containing protein [Pyrinomonadaceae bacterium]